MSDLISFLQETDYAPFLVIENISVSILRSRLK